MNSATLRLVLLLSCCHGLAHVYELSFASVEQLVARDFGVDTAVTGWLGFCLRLPFGLFALAAGWLADRLGARRLLLVYLFGASGAALLACLMPGLGLLFVSMFLLGTFASIYHPAGVGLISHLTRPENRPMALGYHGILGSIGIAAGPFLASFVLAAGASWRHYYLVLTVPGVLLAAILMRKLAHQPHGNPGSDPPAQPAPEEDQPRWDCYFLLIATAVMAGFVYAAVMTFMPRYLTGAGLDLGGAVRGLLERIGLGGVTLPPESVGNFLTGSVLLLGILGQYAAGRFARPTTLEPMMAFAFLATAPCLLWMGFATGVMRIWAAAVFAPVFFLHQPLFNSLIAKYVPRRRRGLAYGLSFSIGFGVGSAGSAFAGKIESALGELGPTVNYSTLAGLAFLSGLVLLYLWYRYHTR